ncbi:MAG: sulfite exporter TauE/SafE family protein [Nanoarchaeota archaeon]|nr:sulfite exporter TauE/SafE family protein [Nanoarchaeota archaeon]
MKKTFKVKGMTCTSCEVLIERKLKHVSGVKTVKVSRAKEQAEVECSENVQLEQLQEAVKDKGYTLYASNDPIENQPKNSFILKDKERYSEIGAVLVVLFAAYFLLTQFNLLPKNFGVTDNMSYGFIFVIGLVAATSTCLAVAGGLLLAVSNKFNENNPDLHGWQKFKPHLYFNVGRISSYTLLGGAIGALGSILTLSSSITGIITIIASLLMIVMGLQLLGIFPWLNKIQIKMPKFIAHKVYDASNQNASKNSLFLFGAATFLLPCGFTQALQLYVLGTGSFTVGALTMLAFSLGTLPSLAGIGAFSSFAKGNAKKYFMTFSAVLVIVLGIFNLTPGFNLVGASVALPVAHDNTVPVPAVGERQIINMEVRGLDYYPDQFTIKKGIPVEWRVDGRNAQGCAGIISVPQLKITERLPRDSIKTIEFTPQKEGKIKFTCGMGMAGPGTFEVVA